MNRFGIDVPVTAILASAIALGVTAARAAPVTANLGASVSGPDDSRLCHARGGQVKEELSPSFGPDGNLSTFKYCLHERNNSICHERHPNGMQVVDITSGTKGLATAYYDYKKNTCTGGGCFLTTACCGLLKLDDNCWELRTLRNFRDSYLASADGGAWDIDEYYEKAPIILENIPNHKIREELYKLYAFTILPCAIFSNIGANRLVRIIYTKRMKKLMNEYL